MIMANLTELRRAQRMVSDALYPEYFGLGVNTKPNEYRDALEETV